MAPEVAIFPDALKNMSTCQHIQIPGLRAGLVGVVGGCPIRLQHLLVCVNQACGRLGWAVLDWVGPG